MTFLRKLQNFCLEVDATKEKIVSYKVVRRQENGFKIIAMGLTEHEGLVILKNQYIKEVKYGRGEIPYVKIAGYHLEEE